MKSTLKILLPFFCIIFLFNACTRDTVEESTCDPTEIPTYDLEIKPFIVKYCAYAGCHVQGFASGDFTSYEVLKDQLNSGFLTEITSGNMPPSYVEEDLRDMTATEVHAFQCWAQAGYPEN